MLLPSKATWLVWDSSKADNLDPVYPGIKVQHVRLSPSSQLTLLPLPSPTFHILVSQHEHPHSVHRRGCSPVQRRAASSTPSYRLSTHAQQRRVCRL